MMCVDFNRREAFKMVLYSMWTTIVDVGWWVRENWINIFVQVVSYSLIVFGFAVLLYGLFWRV